MAERTTLTVYWPYYLAHYGFGGLPGTRKRCSKRYQKYLFIRTVQISGLDPQTTLLSWRVEDVY